VEKSTVPVCTCESIRKVLLLHGADPSHFSVASNPEFLREGTAVTDFLYPDRIVMGVDDDFSAAMLYGIYRPLTEGTYYREEGAIPCPGLQPEGARVIVTNAKSAELIKHASNAFLAMKISFINAMANLAESADANIEEIAYGIGLDKRIGPGFLRAGLGYGGSCLPKDVAAIHFVGKQKGVDFQLFEEVRKINENQKNLFFDKVCDALWTLRGKRLAALGLAFKGDTDDIRESPAIDAIKKLLEQGATVTAFDPAAMERAQAVLPPANNLHYASGIYEACAGADAVLILTDWKDFAEIDLERLYGVLRFPVMIDGRNLYKPQRMIDHGFSYFSMGRPAGFPAQHTARAQISSAAYR